MYTSRVLIANMEKVATGQGQDLSDARALQLIGVTNIADVRACLLTGGREYAPAVRVGSSQVRELVERLQARAADPEDRSLLNDVLIAERLHLEAFTTALISSTAPKGSGDVPSPEPVVMAAARFDRALAALVAHSESARQRSLAPARAALDRAENVLMAIIIATVVLLPYAVARATRR